MSAITTEASDLLVTPFGEFAIPKAAISTLTLHGIVRPSDNGYRLALTNELGDDPGSAGVNNPAPDALLQVIEACLVAMPASNDRLNSAPAD